jgi:L-seryl-tRNA(Ser) seleniumtransferase
MLLLAAVAAGKEVIVSRGELVEIGGSFRVPDVIQQGGAKLREVGTTNRTRAKDYADAMGRKTGALLRVHRSNFDIVGFTETASIADLNAVKKRVPLLYDEGSGSVIDLSRYGFAPAPTIRELLASGVDAVTCSTDKLIGATQGGLILGREDLIAKCRSHPLMRALRVGKETYGVVAATLRAFATGKHEERVPIYRMLAATVDELRARAQQLVRGTNAIVVDSRCALGGGTTPTETIPSVAIEIPGEAASLQRRFLEHDPPVIGRVQNDRFTIDVRTLFPADREAVTRAVQTASGGSGPATR